MCARWCNPHEDSGQDEDLLKYGRLCYDLDVASESHNALVEEVGTWTFVGRCYERFYES